jgi:hypothetical protein
VLACGDCSGVFVGDEVGAVDDVGMDAGIDPGLAPPHADNSNAETIHATTTVNERRAMQWNFT